MDLLSGLQNNHLTIAIIILAVGAILWLGVALWRDRPK
jgi:hypothetical protein